MIANLNLTEAEQRYSQGKLVQLNNGRPSRVSIEGLLLSLEKYIRWSTNLDESEWHYFLHLWLNVELFLADAPDSLKGKLSAILGELSERYRSQTYEVDWSWKPHYGDYWWLSRVPVHQQDPTFRELLERQLKKYSNDNS